MSFLVVTPIGGGAAITLNVSAEGGAGESPPVKIGGGSRSFSGAWRSSVRANKREWSFNLAMMLRADFEAFRAVVANEVTVTISGDAVVPSSGFVGIIEIGQCDYVESALDAADYLMRAALTVRTV